MKQTYTKCLQTIKIGDEIKDTRRTVILKKSMRKSKRQDWDKFVKTSERGLTGAQGICVLHFMHSMSSVHV